MYQGAQQWKEMPPHQSCWEIFLEKTACRWFNFKKESLQQGICQPRIDLYKGHGNKFSCELAEVLIRTGIAPNFIQIGFGNSSSWRKCWGQSKVNKKKRLTTVHPSSSFDGDLVVCQVLFSGSGHSSLIAPQIADKRSTISMWF